MKFYRVESGYCRLVLGVRLLALSAFANAGSAPALLPNPNAIDNSYGNAVALIPNNGSIAAVTDQILKDIWGVPTSNSY